MWHAFLLAKTWKTRPSEIYGIHGEYRAYCFDNAIMTFGLALENALNACDGKTAKEIEFKRNNVFARWLDLPRKFRDPLKDGEL